MSENELEQLCLTWFQETGWDYQYGPDIAYDCISPERQDYRQVILPDRLRSALYRLNPSIPASILEDVLHTLSKPQHLSLVKNNCAFHEMLLSGMPVEYEMDGQKRDSVRAKLRNLVRITLRRYKYPPDKQEEDIQLVLQQAERLSDDWSKVLDTC
jgi:type I restriction enzyme R subunit